MRHEIRRARSEDAGQIAALFQLVYEASSHPCKSEEFIARTLRRKRSDVWHVSECGSRVTGCMGMLPHRWNRSWEIVRGVTHPDFRGGGLATELAQRAVDDAWASGECDLIVGFPRNLIMSHILSDIVKPGLRVIGHDGGINIASGRREYHLVAISFGAGNRLERISCDVASLGTTPFVHDAVLAPLGLSAHPGAYPALLIAGEYPHHPDYGPFTFSYHPFCPSDSLEITAYTGPKADEAAIAADLLSTLESFAYARHVRLAVLADKTGFQSILRSAGFGVTAYLPAWYLQNGIRYDCVLMTRRTTSEEPGDHGTRDLIDHFNLGYSDCIHSKTG